jgi:hypothetical protein
LTAISAAPYDRSCGPGAASAQASVFAAYPTAAKPSTSFQLGRISLRSSITFRVPCAASAACVSASPPNSKAWPGLPFLASVYEPVTNSAASGALMATSVAP